MKAGVKIWWRGEPLIIGSLRWRISNNDLLQAIRKALADFKNECHRTKFI